MNHGINTATQREFLERLFLHTGGEVSGSASMYEVGADLGLDKRQSSELAEELMALGHVEIRTLSGGIGITESGIHELAPERDASTGGANSYRLANGPLLDGAGHEAVQRIQAMVKEEAGALGLDFDALNELLTDLRTIDTQLGSPRPKTAILKACYQSIEAVLAGAKSSKSRDSISKLVKD